MKRAVMALVIVGATACVRIFKHGTTPDRLDLAQHSEGARVALRVRGEPSDRTGELIAVDTIGITIREGRFVRVAWPRVAAMDVAQLGKDYDIRYDEPVTAEKRARLALVSRFPQGLSRLPITIDSLIADAVRETKVFTDRRSAVDAGYRRVGADFPAMGEHWLNVPVLLSGQLDPARPTLLIYADIKDKPTLLGVGFAIVTRGDSVPRDLPGWPDQWHEHSGLLADESGARGDHTHGAEVARDDGDTHVWVMHAWTMLTNPDGAFAAENWSLPYVRAGRAVPRPIDPAASRALALTVGGDEFVRRLLTDASVRTPVNANVVDSLLHAATLRARASVDDGALHETWRMLCDELAQALGPRAVALLDPRHPE